jgi:hypothetical protein
MTESKYYFLNVNWNGEFGAIYFFASFIGLLNIYHLKE